LQIGDKEARRAQVVEGRGAAGEREVFFIGEFRHAKVSSNPNEWA
jgi:hypothetical protein